MKDLEKLILLEVHLRIYKELERIRKEVLLKDI
jgi:hypothetical protein